MMYSDQMQGTQRAAVGVQRQQPQQGGLFPAKTGIPPGPAGGGFRKPGGGYDGSGINPGAGGWQGRGVPQPDPAPRGGEGIGLNPPQWWGSKSMQAGSEPYRDPITGAQVGLDNPAQQQSLSAWFKEQQATPPPGGWKPMTDQDRFLMAAGGAPQAHGFGPGGGEYMSGGIAGGPFGPPRPDMTGGPVGDPAYPVKSGGRPWSYENRNEMQRPGGGYGPYNGYGTPGNGGPIPPGPHGGGPKGFPGMDPSIYPSGWNGRIQPHQTRDQWQQNRLGRPQLPQESPIFPQPQPQNVQMNGPMQAYMNSF